MKYIVIWILMDITTVPLNITYTSYSPAVYHPPQTSGYAIVDSLEQVKNIIKDKINYKVTVFQAESLKEIKYSYTYKIETKEITVQTPVIEIEETKQNSTQAFMDGRFLERTDSDVVPL